MMRHIAFDIETDTSAPLFKYPNGTYANTPGGLDPRTSRVTTISFVSSTGGIAVFDDGEEADLILNVFEYVTRAPTCLYGWNSTFFDLAFLYVRGNILGIKTPIYPVKWRMKDIPYISNYMTTIPTRRDADFEIEPKYGWPEWKNLVTQNGTWQDFSFSPEEVQHFDLAPYFKKYAEEKGIKHSLKPVAESFGIEMIEQDASLMHNLTRGERMSYCTSDANGTMELRNVLDRMRREDRDEAPF